MERAMIEFSNEGCNSAAMESLKRARQRAGITAASIKPASRSVKKTKRINKLVSDVRIAMARTEADIKEHTKRKEEIESEIEKLSRQIGPNTMTVSTKRQELQKEIAKISKLNDIYTDLRKLLVGGR